MRKKRQNKFYFLLQDKKVRHTLIMAVFFSFIVCLFLFLLNAFPLFDSSKNLFLYEIKSFLIKKPWIMLLFFLVWGAIVIRFSWLVAIRQVTAPFERFKKHMQELSEKKEKKSFIHRNYDKHMKGIALTFNNMVEQLFEELDQKELEIKELKEQLKDKRKLC